MSDPKERALKKKPLKNQGLRRRVSFLSKLQALEDAGFSKKPKTEIPPLLPPKMSASVGALRTKSMYIFPGLEILGRIVRDRLPRCSDTTYGLVKSSLQLALTKLGNALYTSIRSY